MSVDLPLELPEFLTLGPLGEIRLAGHRIDFHIMLYYIKEGYSEEMLAGQFPTLEPELIRKAMSFHQDHREKLELYLATVLARLEEQRATGDHAPSLDELRRRQEARRRIETDAVMARS